jgi:hypothetical protein
MDWMRRRPSKVLGAASVASLAVSQAFATWLEENIDHGCFKNL